MGDFEAAASACVGFCAVEGDVWFWSVDPVESLPKNLWSSETLSTRFSLSSFFRKSRRSARSLSSKKDVFKCIYFLVRERRVIFSVLDMVSDHFFKV